jgi:hypothetical protein
MTKQDISYQSPNAMDREEDQRVAALHDEARKQHKVTKVSSDKSSLRRSRSYRESGLRMGLRQLGFCNGIALGDAIRAAEIRRSEWRAAQGEVHSIVHKGVWQVPPEKRPKGWEQMGIKESR